MKTIELMMIIPGICLSLFQDINDRQSAMPHTECVLAIFELLALVKIKQYVSE